MAVWPLLRALGWTPKTRFYAAEAQAFDEWNAKVPNFQEGSSHTGTGEVLLAGTGGFRCTANFTATKCQLTVPTGKTIELTGTGAINAGSTSTITGSAGAQILGAFRLGTAATLTCNGTAGGGNQATLAMGQYSACTHASGSTDVYSSGSSLTCSSGTILALTFGGGGASGTCEFTGATAACVWQSGAFASFFAGSHLNINTALMTLGDNAVCTVNGSSGNVAQMIFGQYSTCALQSGAGFTCASGSIFTLGSGAFVTINIGKSGNAGALNLGADCNTTFEAISSTTHASTSTETYADGSVVTDSSTRTITSNSTVSDASTRTRTGPLIKSGVNAITGQRVGIISGLTTGAVDLTATDYDYVIIGLEDLEWPVVRLVNPAGALAGQNHTLKVYVFATGSAPDVSTISLNNHAGTTIGYYSGQPTAGQGKGFFEFVWTTAWVCVGWGGYVGTVGDDPRMPT